MLDDFTNADLLACVEHEQLREFVQAGLLPAGCLVETYYGRDEQ